ncbi:MAG: Zn-ribbon domain-containing OB-fold protein [Thermoprotei archaeon]
MTVPRYWRNIGAHYRLQGIRCKSCGSVSYPPRSSCPTCHSRQVELVALPRKGKVVTFSTLYSAPEGFELYTPYAVAEVELENGVKVLGQITDLLPGQKVEEGMEVEAVFRKISEDGEEGLIRYGVKFRPTQKRVFYHYPINSMIF